MSNNSNIFGDEENKYAWMWRSQRAGDCWKPVRPPGRMDLGAGSETASCPRRRRGSWPHSPRPFRVTES